MVRKIVIVGNGEMDGESAAEIDAADFVVRFNDCRSFGPGGTRTDAIAVCNTGRPGKAMLALAAWRGNPAVKAAGEIWCVRDPGKFAEMRSPLAISHPELDDFCDDYTNEFSVFCANSGKVHRVVKKEIHNGVDAALSDYAPSPYVVPSSGMIVIFDVLATYPDAAVAIAGFGHQGWEWHPFAAERQLVDRYVAEGRLRRLGPVADEGKSPSILLKS